MCYDCAMESTIGQRELRNDNAEIMRRVQAGERFVVTRSGTPVADLVPHVPRQQTVRRSLAQAQRAFQELPPMDSERWRAERAEDDAYFGPDDPVDDPWQAR